MTSWRKLLVKTCEVLAAERGARFTEAVLQVRGRKRAYFSKRAETLVDPLSLSSADLYVKGNLSANGCANLARRVVRVVLGSDERFAIDLADEPERQ